MSKATKRLCAVLTTALAVGAMLPADAGFIFDRKTRRKIVRTFRPIKKVKKVKDIKKGFTGSRKSRRTYRRTRTVRRRR